MTETCIDSSVLIAATHDWHPFHQPARAALESSRCAVDHAVLEAYSVLTRMPEPGRLDPETAAAAIDDAVHRTLGLPSAARRSLPAKLGALGVSGGASYDGLIALTAAHHRATLKTLDRRAARTYSACGVEFEILG